MFASRDKKAIVLLLLLAALAILVGCAADESPTSEATPVADASSESGEELAEPAEELATVAPTAVQEEEDTESEELAPEPTPTLEPTPEPTPTLVVVVDVDSACVNCHTDVDRLMELAEEPEEVHLSSGEG